MGGFFEKVLLTSMKKFVESGLSDDDAKRLVEIPSTWGAKIGGEQCRKRASEALRKGSRG